MKRTFEVAVLLAACALVASYTVSRPVDPPVGETRPTVQTTPDKARQPHQPPSIAWTPQEGVLYLNGVSLGERATLLKERLGPADFDWPERAMQQWEPRQGVFTRVAYRSEENGELSVTSVEASGTLTRGSQRLIGFADSKEEMLRQLGPPTSVQDGYIYYYPGFSVSCTDLVGMIILGDPEGMGADKD